MGELKKGDEVIVTSTSGLSDFGGIFIKKDNKYKVGYIEGDLVFLCYPAGFVGIKDYCVKKTEDSKLQYELSNRKALKDFISKQGFHSKEISKAMGFNEVYLSAMSGKSRLEARGDLSNEELAKVKIDIIYAVRKLNGAEAQVVDEPKQSNIPESEVVEHLDDIIQDMDKPLGLEPKEPQKPVMRHRVKSKTEVKKSTVWLVLFIIFLVLLFAVTGVWKSIF